MGSRLPLAKKAIKEHFSDNLTATPEGKTAIILDENLVEILKRITALLGINVPEWVWEIVAFLIDLFLDDE